MEVTFWWKVETQKGVGDSSVFLWGTRLSPLFCVRYGKCGFGGGWLLVKKAHRKPKRLELSKTKYPRTNKDIQTNKNTSNKTQRSQSTNKENSISRNHRICPKDVDGFSFFFRRCVFRRCGTATARERLKKKGRKYPTDEGQTDGPTHRIIKS